ncbi:MAG: YbaB/EbfC family nucleoid-associated protein [Labedaea sp.]
MSAYEELMAAPDPRSGIRDSLRALDENLAEWRAVGNSPDGTVTVTVTGNGELVDIAITDRALRGSHPEEVGPAIVAAVRAARHASTRYARDQQQRALHPDTPPQAPPATPAVPPPVSPPRRPQPAVDEESDTFQGFRSGR